MLTREENEMLTQVGRGKPAGEITSGTFSPTVQKPIAMAYVTPRHAEVGTELTVDIRGSQEPARVVKEVLA